MRNRIYKNVYIIFLLFKMFSKYKKNISTFFEKRNWYPTRRKHLNDITQIKKTEKKRIVMSLGICIILFLIK